MQSLKSPYTLYNQQSVGSTLHNNLLFITNTAFLITYRNRFAVWHFCFLLPEKFIAHCNMNYVPDRHISLPVVAIFVLNTPCRAKRSREVTKEQTAICIIGFSPLPGSPPAP